MTPEQLQKVKKSRNILIATAVFAFSSYFFAVFFIPWGWAIYSLLLLGGFFICHNLLKIQKRIKELEEDMGLPYSF